MLGSASEPSHTQRMQDETLDWIEAVRVGFGDRCFACGRKNPEGLHLDDWEFHENEVRSVFRPRPEHVGAADTLHGGLAATVLDETLVWAGIFSEHVLSVTGTLDLRFRRPISIGDEVVAVGRVDARTGRRLRLSGHLETKRGIAAEATGLYVAVEDILGSPSSTS